MAAQAKFSIHERLAENRIVVRPPFDTATKGNPTGLRIVNRTTGRIWVFLPAGVFNEQGGVNPDPVAMYEIASRVAPRDFKVHANATEGSFSFKIFCESTFSSAQGNSDPEFIIEN